MKRVIIALAACLILASCAPIHLVINRTYKGDHIAMTSEVGLFGVDGGTFYASLGGKVSKHDKDTIMAVLIKYDGDTKSGIFNTDDRIIFKLNDGTEFAIYNRYNKEFESSTETVETEVPRTNDVLLYSYSPWMDAVYLSPYRVTRWVPHYYTKRISNSYALYPITKAQLEGVIKTGVAQLRIESEIGDADMPNTENVAGIFADEHQILRKGLKIKQKEF